MFNYNPTPEERAAEKLLKEKGWTVHQPMCPLCHGWGTVGKIEDYKPGQYGWSSERCPNGCQIPVRY